MELSIEQRFDRVLDKIHRLNEIIHDRHKEQLENIRVQIIDLQGIWVKCSEELKKSMEQKTNLYLLFIEKRLNIVEKHADSPFNKPQEELSCN